MIWPHYYARFKTFSSEGLIASPFLMDPKKFFRGSMEGIYNRIIRKDPCSYCGGRIGQPRRNGYPRTRMTIDHIRPESSGHGRYWRNKTPACETCNLAKGAMSLLEFLLVR